MDCLLGIDIGTSGTKSALFGSDGACLDSEYHPYGMIHPRNGWAEQDPHDWWRAIVKTARTLAGRKKITDRIVALSLSTQGGSLLLLDQDFSPIGNAINWMDKRAKETKNELAASISAEELYRTGGWAVMDGLFFPLIFWYKQKNPDSLPKVRYYASTVDYLNHRLSGRFSIDITNLSMTQLFDLEKMTWSEKCLDIAGISREQLPEIIHSGKVIGKLRLEVARELGLDPSTLLVSGAHDQYCANIGAGARNAGDCVLSSGTAWVTTVISDKPVFNTDRTIHPCHHLRDGFYGLISSIPAGGNSLNWFQQNFQQDKSVDELCRMAQSVPAGSGGLTFIPPGLSRSRKGLFYNFDTTSSTSYFVRAVMEGVAFRNKQLLDIIRQNGVAIHRIIMTGGGTKGSLWPRIVADISRLPLLVHGNFEASCAGAAILAGVGSGIYSSIDSAIGDIMPERQIIVPQEKEATIYSNLYNNFVSLLNAY